MAPARRFSSQKKMLSPALVPLQGPNAEDNVSCNVGLK